MIFCMHGFTYPLYGTTCSGHAASDAIFILCILVFILVSFHKNICFFSQKYLLPFAKKYLFLFEIILRKTFTQNNGYMFFCEIGMKFNSYFFWSFLDPIPFVTRLRECYECDCIFINTNKYISTDEAYLENHLKFYISISPVALDNERWKQNKNWSKKFKHMHKLAYNF